MPNQGNVLLVDDNAGDRELVQLSLQDSHCAGEIVVARDGAEALDFLYRRGDFSERTGPPPAIILLDIKMPRVNGIEVLGKIRSDPQLRLIPVVMLTSSPQGRDVEVCYRMGANGYVVKPFDFAQFTATTRTIAQFWCSLNEIPSGVVA